MLYNIYFNFFYFGNFFWQSLYIADGELFYDSDDDTISVPWSSFILGIRHGSAVGIGCGANLFGRIMCAVIFTATMKSVQRGVLMVSSFLTEWSRYQKAPEGFIVLFGRS